MYEEDGEEVGEEEGNRSHARCHAGFAIMTPCAPCGGIRAVQFFIYSGGVRSVERELIACEAGCVCLRMRVSDFE
jgi:hypothetical protein